MIHAAILALWRRLRAAWLRTRLAQLDLAILHVATAPDRPDDALRLAMLMCQAAALRCELQLLEGVRR